MLFAARTARSARRLRPHLGAHLGHGGRGKGSCLPVPCLKVIARARRALRHPAAPRADTTAWHGRAQRAGAGLVPPRRRGAALGPARAPSTATEWTDYTRKDWIIRPHNQEMAENAVDSRYYLHGTQNIPPTEAGARGISCI